MSSTPGNARQPLLDLDRPRLLSLHNGGELTPTFSHEEMEQRLAKLRGELLSNLVYGGLVMRRPCCPR